MTLALQLGPGQAEPGKCSVDEVAAGKENVIGFVPEPMTIAPIAGQKCLRSTVRSRELQTYVDCVAVQGVRVSNKASNHTAGAGNRPSAQASSSELMILLRGRTLVMERRTRNSKECPTCGLAMREVNVWLDACPGCRYMKSSLTSGVGAPVEGIEYLRRRNFEALLDRLSRHKTLKDARLLEPGCEKGGFSKPPSVAG